MIKKSIAALIKQEEKRQEHTLNLIASENYVSHAVRDAMGSVLTNKYSEGYPGARYYSGNSIIDVVETRARTGALKLFNLPTDAWGVNVQPYSGSPANFAVYTALVPPGGTILSLELNMGGHLTHGHSVSATSKFWKFIHYQVDATSKLLDYAAIEAIAVRERPHMIVAGYSAYARAVDFQAFKHIADKAGAILFADFSHIAGLVAGGVHASPFPHADVAMTTIHKTLRGP
ncbi:MAG: serine hydroxymethyltransferase, partial [Patescibacteria group bacterium]